MHTQKAAQVSLVLKASVADCPLNPCMYACYKLKLK